MGRGKCHVRLPRNADNKQCGPPREEYPMRVLALDLSTTNIGWVVFQFPSYGFHVGYDLKISDGWLEDFNTITPEGRYAPDRMKQISDALRQLIDVQEPTDICYEMQAGRNSPNSFDHTLIIGMLLAHALDKGLKPVGYAPLTIKKCLTGHGHAQKPDMVRVASKMLKNETNEHEADAFGVLLAFLENKGRTVKENSPKKPKTKKKKQKGLK